LKQETQIKIKIKRICGSIMSKLTIDQSLQALLNKKHCANVGSGSLQKETTMSKTHKKGEKFLLITSSGNVEFGDRPLHCAYTMKDKIFYQNPFTQYFYVGSGVKEIFNAILQQPLLSKCMAQQSSKLVYSRKAL